MKTIKIYVWWSAGSHGHDSDGYDEEIEVTDEQFEVLKELGVTDEELCNIEDPRIKDFCQETSDEYIDEIVANSIAGSEDLYRDDCLIDPSSNEYDPNGEEEQFTQTREDWMWSICMFGVRFAMDEEGFEEQEDED